MSESVRLKARPLARVARLLGLAAFVAAITGGVSFATRLSTASASGSGDAGVARRVILRDASLRGAPMESASLANAVLTGADLRNCRSCRRRPARDVTGASAP